MARNLLSGLLVILLLLVASASAEPRQSATPPAEKSRQTVEPRVTPSLTAEDLGAWIDGYMEGVLEPGKIAGAQVVVVKDGHILLERGYGYADLAARRPMDPGSVQMRIGSTSKLFTWTAVMQLVEAGKIDLNADVNRYLDFRITPPGTRAVTMADLMTHRGGFEEGLKDVLANDASRLKSTERYLKENSRPFLFAPGHVPAYSNYGTALAGYIVERVSGEDYDSYVERHILAPLRMTASTTRQPLPPEIAATLAKGYRTSGTAPSPIELAATAPAGSISATGGDMANFMIAHLQEGRFEDATILRPETARLMHEANRPALPGFATMAHGFFRSEKNGRIVIGHGGDTVVFHSDLNLLPQEGVGIFVSFNSRGENDAVYPARERLFSGFMDRYFPARPSVTPPAIASAGADGRAIAGYYETSRRVETGFIALFYLLQQDRVDANPDGTISLASAPGKRFRETARGLWREVDGPRRLFVTETSGRITIVDSENPIAILQQASLGRSAGTFQLVGALSLLILIATSLTWLIAAWVLRTRRLPAVAAGRMALVRRVVRVFVVADLIYLAGWYAILAPILQSDVGFYNDGVDWALRSLQLAGSIPLLGAIFGIANFVMSFRQRLDWAVRLRALIVALGLAGFAWIAWTSGLISWTLNY